MYPNIKEFNNYIPAIIKGKDLSNTLRVSNLDVEVKLFSIPNTKKYLAIAINHDLVQTTLTVKFDRKFAGKKVTTDRTKTKITQIATDASFSTLLKPYEVLICKIG